jgi:two-component system LytT family response regulator
MHVLIVDDEAPARRRIRRWLEREPDVTAIEECSDGCEAVTAIRERRPDVVLLDVQMPALDGLGVIHVVGAGNMPLIIFTTAHQEHALEAFSLEALDYLLKPLEEERFRSALVRVRRELHAGRGAQWAARLRRVTERFGVGDAAQSVVVSRAGWRSRVPAVDIDFVEAEDNYVRVHHGGRSDLVRGRISAFEARLDPASFIRVHRSYLVNTDRIQHLRTARPASLRLKDGRDLPVGSSYIEPVRRRLGL